ncbi:hypothetical protein [Allorhodopirellula heiligendammensis]|uniref:Uncharacterized protein n=1 Tax=Allorhodopirellula heiligendammensis TaxID=2714739 RepID=A0A5C6BDG7_9BACT|nr:hypothetical protein [Allorhodopirellula heiligendammensis]TWU10010.1 hypothetical protein Poly21_53430 [Allorhodopirellula heiligendammensis]|tara:strand:- start:195 stop:425 length:231 start_codon:yes stop_codon:yes gene_type:complete
MARVVYATLLSVLPATVLFAHEGHGHTAPGQGNSLWHYVTEPQHAWVLTALVVVAAAVALYRWSQRNVIASADDLS